MAFLAQQLACYVWFGVIVATMGFAVSGISDYVHDVPDGYEKYGIAAGKNCSAYFRNIFLKDFWDYFV